MFFIINSVACYYYCFIIIIIIYFYYCYCYYDKFRVPNQQLFGIEYSAVRGHGFLQIGAQFGLYNIIMTFDIFTYL